MSVRGTADEGYGPVAEAFASVLPEDRRGGAALALYRDGRLVVDLWGGTARTEPATPWERDTMSLLWSATKGVTTVLVLRLAERGLLDLDAPVARYWPEFGQAGKERITLRHVLGHRAGLPLLEGELGFAELMRWQPPVTVLQGQKPRWEPGTAYAYHGFTFGWILGEVIRRVTGYSVGAHLRQDLAEPLGLDLHLGVPEPERGRVARQEGPDHPMPTPPPEHVLYRILTVNGAIEFPGLDSPHGWNAPALLGAELPATAGVGTARSLAGLYAATVTGIDGRPPLLGAATLQDALRPLSRGGSWPDGMDLGAVWGSGFHLDGPFWHTLGSGSFGHDGTGGTHAFGDVEHRVGYAFVTSRLGGAQDTREERLMAAVRRCLG
ncbi:serine hydrolase domain-containing protein [Streptomyces sp. NPDC005438]|uniref:serine hydrolase domain-containing protein n=1 Tax=Streptomyces sp. NPDC005438 TaxID=3156880 RepID=UPI0033BC6CAF